MVTWRKLNYIISSVLYKQESVSYLFNDQGDANEKFLYISLKDGNQVQLRLFKEGYVSYTSSHVFFKMQDEVFHRLWNELE
ncbi:MAG: hypothetical protein Q8936_13210 [Bacillota bacterium]|nr:hypothetical protein [Bacillota bacterium]